MRTHNSGRAVFLNSHDPYGGHFLAVVFPERWDCWSQSPEVYFRDRWVRVQGRIEMYQGSPQIVVRTCAQVQLLQRSEEPSPPDGTGQVPACGEELHLEDVIAAVGANHPMVRLAKSECLWVIGHEVADVTGDGVADELFISTAAGCGSCHFSQLRIFVNGQLAHTHGGAHLEVLPNDSGSGLDVVESWYLADEPLCCPSHKKVTHLVWTGPEFRDWGSEVVPVPTVGVSGPGEPPAVPGCVSWAEAARHVGQRMCVYGIVTSTYDSGKAFFVNFSQQDRSAFHGVSFDYYWTELERKCVVLEGLIEEYQGRPQIVIRDQAQIHSCHPEAVDTRGESGPPASAGAPQNQPEAPALNLPEEQGCYLFTNYLGAELTVTFTRQSDNWNDTFTVAVAGELPYCLDPGHYTYTIDAPPPWDSINGELDVSVGDRYRWPVMARD